MNAADAPKWRLEPHPEFGFLRIQPTPSQEEIEHFYAQEFYSSRYAQCNDSSLEVQLQDKEFYEGSRSDLCDNLVDLMGKPLDGLEVLDIGCGWGQALLHFRDRGMHCYGFDPVPEAVGYARDRGLEVVQAGMQQMDAFGGKRFDVVTLMNVLEHLADPVESLRQIREVLKPGGILVIDVPNEFNPFQLCGQRVHDLQEWWVAPPAHLNYFNPDSLRRLLNGVSFEVKRLEASFPIEMFLLFGHKYVGDGALGRRCHEQRMAFELNLRKHGFTDQLRRFYRSLAEQGLGRQTVAYGAVS